MTGPAPLLAALPAARYGIGEVVRHRLLDFRGVVFDVYPDRSPFGAYPGGPASLNYPANQQYIPYSIFSPFGFNGRFLYGRVGVSF
jgi:hypothetical protein